MPSVYSYVWWRGGKLNRASIASLVQVEKLSHHTLRVIQGGFNAGRVSASAGTHDGGGAVDISVRGWSAATRNSVCVWMRRCGWAAWVRGPAQGFSWHIHGIRIGDASASRSAKSQVIAYRLGRTGLASNHRDTLPRPGYVSWEKSRYNPANKPRPAPKKTLTISGKVYNDIESVSVWYINHSRARKSFSRHTFILQTWLTKLGYKTHGHNNGLWSAALQTDLDRFRWDNRRALKIHTRAEAGGSIGIYSLTLLRKKVGSSRKVRRTKKR